MAGGGRAAKIEIERRSWISTCGTVAALSIYADARRHRATTRTAPHTAGWQASAALRPPMESATRTRTAPMARPQSMRASRIEKVPAMASDGADRWRRVLPVVSKTAPESAHDTDEDHGRGDPGDRPDHSEGEHGDGEGSCQRGGEMAPAHQEGSDEGGQQCPPAEGGVERPAPPQSPCAESSRPARHTGGRAPR